MKTPRIIDLASARVRATRITYVGELGWELYILTEFALSVYDAIIEAGSVFDLKHTGYHAMNSQRVEKGYRHWGHDINADDRALEVGLCFADAFDIKAAFIEAAHQYSATIHAREKVYFWEVIDNGVVVKTNRDEYQARKLIFTAGA